MSSRIRQHQEAEALERQRKRNDQDFLLDKYKAAAKVFNDNERRQE